LQARQESRRQTAESSLRKLDFNHYRVKTGNESHAINVFESHNAFFQIYTTETSRNGQVIFSMLIHGDSIGEITIVSADIDLVKNIHKETEKCLEETLSSSKTITWLISKSPFSRMSLNNGFPLLTLVKHSSD
jgi:hypothetical protein